MEEFDRLPQRLQDITRYVLETKGLYALDLKLTKEKPRILPAGYEILMYILSLGRKNGIAFHCRMTLEIWNNLLEKGSVFFSTGRQANVLLK